jgi:DNA polymerase III sliding clamp (beta) subunit (PCNA family)
VCARIATLRRIEVILKSGTIYIAFNGKYLLAVLLFLSSETVHLDLTDALKLGVLMPVKENGHSETPDYLCGLMPTQIA